MDGGKRGVLPYLAAAAAVGVVPVLVGSAAVWPFPALRGVLPAVWHDRVTLAGLVVLAVVALCVALVVALKVTVFVMSLVFSGREALAQLPDVDPLIGGALGVVVVGAVVMGGGAVMTSGVGGAGGVPYVEDAFDGGPRSAHGVVADDELRGIAYADRPLPDYRDTDGDRLPDQWERAGETPAGVPLPGADPDRKDLYVQVNYASGTAPLNASETRQLRRIWADMRVSNPDGTTGITIHLVDEPPRGGRIPNRVAIGSGGFGEPFLRTYYNETYMGERTCSHYLAVFGEVDGKYTGWGLVPGYLSVVDGTERGRSAPADTTVRVRTLTHELLHNVVGMHAGGGSHTQSGWLAGGSNAEFRPRLADVTSTELNRSGFARSHPIELGVCDRPVGATLDDGN